MGVLVEVGVCVGSGVELASRAAVEVGKEPAAGEAGVGVDWIGSGSTVSISIVAVASAGSGVGVLVLSNGNEKSVFTVGPNGQAAGPGQFVLPGIHPEWLRMVT